MEKNKQIEYYNVYNRDIIWSKDEAIIWKQLILGKRIKDKTLLKKVY